MFSGSAGAALLTVLAPILKIVLEAFGRSFNDWMAGKRAEEAQHELGETKAKLDTANVTIGSQQQQLDAQANAPQTVDDALKRLEDGSA